MSKSSIESEIFVPVMDRDAIEAAICRIADAVLSHHGNVSDLVIAGIQTRGVEVARRMVEYILKKTGVQLEVSTVDVSMHRDDLATRQRMTAVEATQLPLDLNERPLLLVDDVLYTGRSCRAAMDAIASYGRPLRIGLAVLVDRGHRELPIQADYVGKHLNTQQTERVRVRFENVDGLPDCVGIVRSAECGARSVK